MRFRTSYQKRIPLLSAFILLLCLGLVACAPITPEGDTSTEGQEESVPEDAAVEESAAEESTDEDSAGADTEPAQMGSTGAAAQLEPAERNGMYTEPPAMTIDTEKYYYATIKTEKGDITVQLFAERSPITVNNFVFLAREGFYDNTTFHRVLDGFMAQTGDPTGTGGGGTGYQFQDEFFPGLEFDRPGLLAMANAGPGTNGSQFFITFAPTLHLNQRHTIFGEVLEGRELLAEITRRDPGQQPDFPGDLVLTVEIEEAEGSILPTPTPPPPTPTPFPPSSMDSEGRPLAELPNEEKANYFSAPPEVTLDTSKSYEATLTTSKGDIVIALQDDAAPIAVNNFIILVELGFYDGVPINQVSPGQFTIFGSPDNNPQSDAGYKQESEIVSPDVSVDIGTVGYLPVGGPPIISSSSQVFIAIGDLTAQVQGAISAFGEVTEGIELVETLTDEDVIETITITVSE